MSRQRYNSSSTAARSLQQTGSLRTITSPMMAARFGLVASTVVSLCTIPVWWSTRQPSGSAPYQALRLHRCIAEQNSILGSKFASAMKAPASASPLWDLTERVIPTSRRPTSAALLEANWAISPHLASLEQEPNIGFASPRNCRRPRPALGR